MARLKSDGILKSAICRTPSFNLFSFRSYIGFAYFNEIMVLGSKSELHQKSDEVFELDDS